MFLFVYRLALRAYPKSFKDEYEEEMLATFGDLLAYASGHRKLVLCLSSVMEVFQWALRERLEVADTAISSIPGLIISGYLVSASLLMPFCLAGVYRLHMLADRESHPRWLGLLVYAQPWFEGILPTLALVILLVTSILFLRSASTRQELRYFLGLGLIGCLAIIALV